MEQFFQVECSFTQLVPLKYWRHKLSALWFYHFYLYLDDLLFRHVKNMLLTFNLEMKRTFEVFGSIKFSYQVKETTVCWRFYGSTLASVEIGFVSTVICDSLPQYVGVVLSHIAYRECKDVASCYRFTVGLSVCWSHPWALQEWLNWSKCCLVCGLGWAQGTM